MYINYEIFKGILVKNKKKKEKKVLIYPFDFQTFVTPYRNLQRVRSCKYMRQMKFLLINWCSGHEWVQSAILEIA